MYDDPFEVKIDQYFNVMEYKKFTEIVSYFTLQLSL